MYHEQEASPADQVRDRRPGLCADWYQWLRLRPWRANPRHTELCSTWLVLGLWAPERRDEGFGMWRIPRSAVLRDATTGNEPGPKYVGTRVCGFRAWVVML